eukprot:TRINITY_DN17078_c0_g1_i1.p1 TRINITY_DN17078_c0_g1~~TRINITY_DN17078_c0_g1_i1.p1  ORF type:complete len:282 (+),score=56.85 TRINITY_DN17078_c0_g1_i1:16-861(+)
MSSHFIGNLFDVITNPHSPLEKLPKLILHKIFANLDLIHVAKMMLLNKYFLQFLCNSTNLYSNQIWKDKIDIENRVDGGEMDEILGQIEKTSYDKKMNKHYLYIKFFCAFQPSQFDEDFFSIVKIKRGFRAKKVENDAMVPFANIFLQKIKNRMSVKVTLTNNPNSPKRSFYNLLCAVCLNELIGIKNDNTQAGIAQCDGKLNVFSLQSEIKSDIDFVHKGDFLIMRVDITNDLFYLEDNHKNSFQCSLTENLGKSKNDLDISFCFMVYFIDTEFEVEIIE